MESGATYKPLVQADGVPSPRPGEQTGEVDIVQFGVPVFVVSEDDGAAKLPLMRIGAKTGTVSVSYTTQEGSATAGEQFEHVSGTITLKPGVGEETISVPLLNTPSWNATKEFSVLLSEPDGCDLGLYLKIVRVKIIDTTAFPSDHFKEQVQQGEEAVENIWSFSLFPSFIALMWDQPGISWRTLIMVLIGVLKNLYGYMILVLSVYMVDNVFDLKFSTSNLLIPGSRLHTAYVVAVLWVSPVVVFFLLDHISVRMDVRGRLRAYVAKSLFRKFMNYSVESSESTPLPDMVGSVTIDADEVSDGYLKVIGIVQVLGKIGISIFFTLQHNPDAWWAVVVVPVIMMIWVACRTNPYVDTADETGSYECALAAFLNEALVKLDLVATYQQRPQVNEIFAKKAEGLRTAKIHEHAAQLTNMVMPKLLGPGLVAAYTAIGAQLVLGNSLNLGVYLATISVFKDICDAFSELFGFMMDIVATLPGLKGLTVLLNKRTDVPNWLECIEKRARITSERRAAMTRSDSTPKVDKLAIELVDVGFSHPGMEQTLFAKLNFTCPQGKLCVVRGESGQGRRTMLQLIAHCHFPTSGTLFIPSHLRIVFVSREVVLIKLSVWENLTFGNKQGNNPHRVEKILEHFKMKKVLQLCKGDMEARKNAINGHAAGEEEEESQAEDVATGTSPMDRLRESEKAEIHMCRAFVMNPEVMVMHRPFVHHSQGAKFTELKTALEEQRDSRGMFMSRDTLNRRRPRTIFFTTDNTEQMKFADLVWVLPYVAGGKCRQLSPDEVTKATVRI